MLASRAWVRDVGIESLGASLGASLRESHWTDKTCQAFLRCNEEFRPSSGGCNTKTLRWMVRFSPECVGDCLMSVKRRFQLAVLFLAAAAFLVVAACAPKGSSGPNATINLQGAGATFPNPLYQKWLSEYGKLHQEVKIDYQSIGSGGGIKQVQSQTWARSRSGMTHTLRQTIRV